MSTPKKAGVIGWPIEQSRSPLIHGHWLQTHNIGGSYEKYAVAPEELPHFIAQLTEKNLSGINVTIPHKELVLQLADKVTETAKAIGAANTLWFENNQLVADNTDSYGFITHLKNNAPHWSPNHPAMILGAGGAARAIIHALKTAGVPKIYLTNRTKTRAENLAEEFGLPVKVIPWQDKEQHLNDTHLLVNSTSLGMTGKPPLEINLTTMPTAAIVYDIVYVPLETELLSTAKSLGLTPIDGLGMLLHQAVPGFEQWFGTRPIVTDDLRQLIVNDLEHA